MALIAAPFFVDADQFRPMLQTALSEKVGREVRIGKLSLSLFAGRVWADEIEIAEDPAFGATPFLRASGLAVGVQLKPLVFEKRLLVDEIVIELPDLRLIQNQRMQWNFASLGGTESKAPEAPDGAQPGQDFDLSIQRIQLKQGTVLLQTAGGRKGGIILEALNLDLQDVSKSSATSFSLSGSVKPGAPFLLEGKVGPLKEAQILESPLDARFHVENLNLVESGAVNASAGLKGSLSADGTLLARDGVATLQTQSQIANFALGQKATPAPRPIALNATVEHRIASHRGVVREADLQAGEARARLNGNYRVSPSATQLSLDLKGNKMPVDELKAFLPAFGVVLPEGATLQGGTLSIFARTTGTSTNPTIAGAASFDDTVLAGYSLGRAIETAARLAGLKVGKDTQLHVFSANVNATRQQTELSDVQLEVPGLGTLSGALRIAEDQSLAGAFTARVESSGGIAGEELARITGSERHVLTIPLTITGTSTQPIVGADTKAMLNSAVKDVRKAIVPKAKTFLEQLLSGKQEEEAPPEVQP